MSKAVMISIKEIHNKNIESGRKISELRTLPPKLKPPFKVYTYESGFGGRHKIVNEWICKDMITWRIIMGVPAHLPKVACVSIEEIKAYSGKDYKNITEMKISDLKIYDKPKELSEFYTICTQSPTEITCRECPNKAEFCFNKKKPLTRSFQSWGYVEEI